MPKLRSQIEREERQKAFELATARAKVEQGFKTAEDMAEAMDMRPPTMRYRLSDPLRLFGFEEASRYAKVMGLTGRECCAILGVAYE